MEGWSDTEEDNDAVGAWQHRILNAIDNMHSQVERLVWANWPDYP
jgi:hypothetical protein